MDGAWNSSHRPFDFRMAGVADQHDRSALLHIALPLAMNFRDEGTGGIKDGQSKRGGFVLDGAGNAMGTEDRARAMRNLIQTLDKAGAFRLEALDNMAIVDNFMADIDRRPIFLERAFHDFDRANDAGTKSARLRQNDFHVICLVPERINLSNRSLLKRGSLFPLPAGEPL